MYIENHLSIYGRIILKWIFKIWERGGLQWINLAVNRERGQTLLNAVVNLRVL
jgi:hypothetical protein